MRIIVLQADKFVLVIVAAFLCPMVSEIWFNTGSGYGLLPEGTKP